MKLGAGAWMVGLALVLLSFLIVLSGRETVPSGPFATSNAGAAPGSDPGGGQARGPTSDGRLEEVDPGSSREPATIQFLLQSSAQPPGESLWRFESADRVFFRRTDSTGRVRIPAGTWKVASTEPGWRLLEESFTLGQGDRLTAWIGSGSPLEVLLFDARGDPVEGASVRWSPRTEWSAGMRPIPFWKRRFECQGRTGSDGIASLDLSSSVGTLFVLADGFLPSERYLSRGLSETLRIGLTPAPAQETPVRIVDVSTHDPVEGAAVLTRYGRLDGESDAGGLFRLPDWVFEHGRLLDVQAEGYCPVSLSASGLGDPPEIEIAPVARLRVTVVSSDRSASARATLSCTIRSDPVSNGWTEVPETEQVEIGKPVVLRVPRRSTVELVAQGGNRGGGRLTLAADSDEENIRISLDPSTSLRIEVAIEGIPARGKITARLRDRRRVIRDLDETGAAYVALPDIVEGIEVEGPDLAPLLLVPSPRVGAPRGGTVHVAAQRALQARVRAVDGRGHPVPGVLLEFSEWETIRTAWLREDLGGAWPTDHRAWNLRPLEPLRGTTGADGSVVAKGFVPGRYVVDGRVHPLTKGALGSLDVGRAASATLWIPADAELEYEFTVLCLLSLEVFDAETGRPVELVQISSPGDEGQIASRTGNFWQGWLPCDSRGMAVGSPGYEPMRLFPSADDTEGIRTVQLRPATPTRIVIEGDVEGLRGEPLDVATLERVVWGGGSNLVPVWHDTVRVSDEGWFDYFLPPVQSTRELFLRIKSKKGGVTFEPRFVPWTDIDRLSVRVTSSKSSSGSRQE